LALTKERKQNLVAAYKEMIDRNHDMVLTTYSALTVKQLEELRAKIREIDGEFHVVKNTLAKIAFEEKELSFPVDALEGTTAIGFTSGDVSALAKALMDLAKEVDTFKVKYAMVEGILYDQAKVKQLSELPPLEIVQSQLLSLIQTPATKVAGTIAASARQLVNVFNAYAEKDGAAA